MQAFLDVASKEIVRKFEDQGSGKTEDAKCFYVQSCGACESTP